MPKPSENDPEHIKKLREEHEALTEAHAHPDTRLLASAATEARVDALGEQSCTDTLATMAPVLEERGVMRDEYVYRGDTLYRKTRKAERATVTVEEAAEANLTCTFGTIRGWYNKYGSALPSWLIITFANYYGEFKAACNVDAIYATGMQ